MGSRDLSRKIKIDKGFIGKVSDDVEVRLQGILFSNYNKIEKPNKLPINPITIIQSWESIYKGNTEKVESIDEILRKNNFNGPLKDNSVKCKKCGSSDLVELHHRKALKNVKNNVKMLLLAKSTRAVIPLCRECHKDVHGGSFK